MSKSLSVPGRSARGVTLVDTVVVAGCAALLAAVLAVSLGDSRRAASLTRSLGNMQVFAEGTRSYAGEYQERVWTFSWRANTTQNSPYVDLNVPTGNDSDAAANEAIAIIRRGTSTPSFPTAFAWVPHPYYSSLVLASHLGVPLPAEFTVSPGDPARQSWLRSPMNACVASIPPYGCGIDTSRLPFSSSYQLGFAFVSADAGAATLSPGGGQNSLVTANGMQLGRRRLDEVSFPSQKVMVSERAARFFGRPAFWGYPVARVPVMMVDGSADVRRTGDANGGFRPTSPNSTTPVTISYSPTQVDEPPTLFNSSGDTVNGSYLWTRSGLRGRDFGGPDVPWTP